jgi:hypothetical protein
MLSGSCFARTDIMIRARAGFPLPDSTSRHCLDTNFENSRSILIRVVAIVLVKVV